MNRSKQGGEPSGIVLRRAAGLPVYLQLVDQFRYLIAAGRFRVGEYLPPMRQIADEIGLNLNTVLRAYSELQRDGLIRSTRGKGAVVIRSAPVVSPPANPGAEGCSDSIDEIIATAVERALSAGLNPSDVLARTQAAIDSAGTRAPTGPAVVVLAAPVWRARVFADALRAIGLGRVRAASPQGAIAANEIVVLPVFGVTAPESDAVGAPTLTVSVQLDRASIRELLELDPRAVVAVVAGDEVAAKWLSDAVAGYAGSARINRLVAETQAEAEVGEASVVVVEAGMPNGGRLISAARLIMAGVSIPISFAESLGELAETLKQ
ncbi:MAG: GntR family transcriptional regulator [Acidobacteria bacterium]|nr:GntR family transcriptional regulator [Acidobacteriota bacterium]